MSAAGRYWRQQREVSVLRSGTAEPASLARRVHLQLEVNARPTGRLSASPSAHREIARGSYALLPRRVGAALDDGHQAACTAWSHVIGTDRRDRTRREESPRALSGFAACGALQRSAASRPGGRAIVGPVPSVRDPFTPPRGWACTPSSSREVLRVAKRNRGAGVARPARSSTTRGERPADGRLSASPSAHREIARGSYSLLPRRPRAPFSTLQHPSPPFTTPASSGVFESMKSQHTPPNR
jgi:hypothetical protein